MKITEIQGDLFAGLLPGDVIAHGANCRGIMGAGVAKGIKAMSKKNFDEYLRRCEAGSFKPGDALGVYEQNLALWIYNLGTQMELGADAHVENVRVSVKSMINIEVAKGTKKIKTVRLGCGIGGLNWDDVKPVLEAIPTRIELVVYYF